jgi:hypothetical protein
MTSLILVGIATVVAFDGTAPVELSQAQKLCCQTAESIPLPGGSKYANPYAAGHMKADGSCGEINSAFAIAEPRERFGGVVQCRTLAMYNEDPWEDVGCQAACMACTTCDLATESPKTTTAKCTPSDDEATCNAAIECTYSSADAECQDAKTTTGTGACGAKMKTFDPLDECQPNDDGWANLDMDSLTGGYEYMKNSPTTPLQQSEIEKKISLTFGTKEAHMDSDRKVHGDTAFPSAIDSAPAVDFVYQALNKRYFLPCKQRSCENPIGCLAAGGGSECYSTNCNSDPITSPVSDPDKFDGNAGWAIVQKTIKVTITRPKDLTEFGGEWVQSFPKDSWQNKTNEYEPYTFNDYGSKIPLAEFREVTVDDVGRKITLDAQDKPQVNVFMRMDEDGDYEIRYGNPHLSYAYDATQTSWTQDNWEPLGILQQHIAKCTPIDDEATCNAAIECTYSSADAECQVAISTEKRRWVAVEFKKSQLRVGSPWSNCDDVTGTEGSSDYSSVGTIVPVYLGNPSLMIQAYQDLKDTLASAYEANNCGVDGANGACVKTKVILAIFTDDADSNVQDGGWTEGPEADGVAGWSTTSPCPAGKQCAKKEIMHCDRRWQEGMDKTAANGCQIASYDKCYSAGEACPLDHSVCKKEYCELQRWREIIKDFSDLGSHVQVLGLVETKKNKIPRDTTDIQDDINKYLTHTPGIDGFYLNEAHGTKADVNDLMTIMAAHASKFNVFGLGEPLFDLSAPNHAGAPDVWMTLNGEDTAGPEHESRPDKKHAGLGFWTPFSWFPTLPTTTWGSMMYDVDTEDVVDMLELLIDRGYGYVYLHSASNYASESSHLKKLVSEMGTLSQKRRRLDEIREERRLSQLRGERPGERRLQAVDDGTTRRRWGCDETLLQCKPVCLETSGFVTNIVRSSQCGNPVGEMSECSCRCFYDVHWACKGDEVVCMATRSGEAPAVVGELVCITRGAPKPDISSSERKAGVCEAGVRAPRGTNPTNLCFAVERQADAKRKRDAMDQGQVWNMELKGMDDLMAGSVPTLLAAMAVLYM